MSAIDGLQEAWAGHSGKEVEDFLKLQIGAAIAAAGGKVGFVDLEPSSMMLRFFSEQGQQNPMFTVGLGGDIFRMSLNADVDTTFYILADETSKVMTITPATQKGSFGSDVYEPFAEDHLYSVDVNTGNGYVNRIPPTNILNGASASFDIRDFVATGNNYIRVTVQGVTSGAAATFVFTAVVTTLSLTVNHAWQNVWNEGESYVLSGIRFTGSIEKYLHVAIDGVELDPARYGPNESYTTTSTTYTIPASAFPASGGNGVHVVTMWMGAQGISTPVVTYHIMCVAEDDTTPMVAINDISSSVVNFTSGTLFGYAVYNADRVTFNLSAMLGGTSYAPQRQPQAATELQTGMKYALAYGIEIDTGSNLETIGTFTASATPYSGSTSGTADTFSTAFDNTYSYIATAGALFYLNAATRDNSAADYQSIVNEMGASRDGNFAASYSATWNGFSWTNDGWVEEQIPLANGGTAVSRALLVPAGATLTVPEFKPLYHVSSYPGFTVEMMIKCGHPSEYNTPVFSMFSGTSGLKIYPTKISVFGTLEGDEVFQSVNLPETKMVHLAVTFTKDYGGVANRNLVSVYVNGISNVNFSFQGGSDFGNGPLTIGQANTDAYLYKMRVYGMALEPRAVFNNFLNAIIDNVEFVRREQYLDNEVVRDGSISYQACKDAGYNIMIIKMTDASTRLPSFDHPAPSDGYPNCSMQFEYADHPEWNVTVNGLSVDGQGTTSKQYFRWNLRGKTKSSTTWTYADGTVTTGKSGYFAGPNRPKVDRITAKKNYASSMQGHKMGMTGLYNDLYKQRGFGSRLPNEDFMVAVYQYPFVGFMLNQTNNTLEYIGLYTAGPDKASKVTFGYSDTYPDALSLEGPDHDPRGTRFLHPWVDAAFSPDSESLTLGGESCWDCDYVQYETSRDDGTQADWDNIFALYESEWKPAYELVYHCSPYIESLSVALSQGGYANLAALNADITNFLKGKTNGVKNELLSFYDSNYDLVFYRNRTGQFDYLTSAEGKSTFNVKTYLGLTGSPTTASIISARATKFKNEIGNYFDLDQTIFHYCFCILFGVTDNFAKNSYPFKFRRLTDTGAGNRWGWRQDDLDTVLATDNNGRNTKSYSVEHGDLGTDDAEIFQGGDSALWVLIRDNYQTKISEDMASLVRAADAIANSLGISGDGLHDSLFNLVSYYCWEHSSKYFPATLYEADKEWSYIEPWLIDDTARYNNVSPLTQALGDQYQSERLWVERRIAYIFSKYLIGAFHGDTAGYGRIALTLAQAFQFNIVPAIDLYPSVSRGQNTDTQAGRTSAGTSVALEMAAGGGTTNYIHGGDWLASLGDLSGMLLSARAGQSSIEFAVNNARIQELKVGDANPSNVAFNATSFAVQSPTITLIDARNVTTLTQGVDLTNCPRLVKALFEGSSARGLTLPKGAKLNEVSFPATASLVFMHSLPFLEPQNVIFPSYAGVQNLCVNNCPHFNPLALARDILATPNNTLQRATLVWREPLVASLADINALFEMTDLVGYVDDNAVAQNGSAWVEGPLSSNEEISSVVYAKIEDSFPRIQLDFDLTKVYIDFADSAVEAIALANWDTITDDDVITLDEARSVTTIGSLFRANTSITSFDELRFFEGITQLKPSGQEGTTSGCFYNCTNLVSVKLPKTVTYLTNSCFHSCSSLESINLENIETMKEHVFNGCSALQIEVNCPNLISLAGQQCHFRGAGITKIVSLGSITTIPNGPGDTSGFASVCTNLTEVTLPDTLTFIGSYAFDNDTNLININIPDNVTEVGRRAFYNVPADLQLPKSITTIRAVAFAYCTGITSEIDLPNLLTLENGAFYGCSSIEKIKDLGRITTTSGVNNQGTFAQCTSLKEVILPDTLQTIGVQAFLNCTGINTTIAFPESLRTVNNQAFSGCYNANFTGFENITTIGSEAFRNTFSSNSEAEIYLRDITSLSSAAFIDTCIKKVTIGPNLIVIGGGGNTGCFRYYSRTDAQNSLEEVVIEGNSLTTIGQECFYNRTALTKINFPTSITTINSQAFYNTRITGELNLPNLTSIFSGAFYNTRITKIISLGQLSIINGASNNGAFQYCTSLTEVTLPSTLREIGAYTFADCTALSSINLPVNLAVLRNGAFIRCAALAIDVNLPNLTVLEGDVFRNTGITKISSLGSITTIPSYEFYQISSLIDATLPSTITSIQTASFQACSNMESCTVLATTPPTITNSSFNDCTKLKLYVPAASIANYYTASNWVLYCAFILPIGVNDLSMSIISGVRFSTNGNNRIVTADADYSVTFPVAIPDAYHSITFNFGFSNSSYVGLFRLNQYGHAMSTYDTASAQTRTIAFNDSSIKAVRMTIKTSELANCYIYDETAGEYLWRGSDVTTIYE